MYVTYKYMSYFKFAKKGLQIYKLNLLHSYILIKAAFLPQRNLQIVLAPLVSLSPDHSAVSLQRIL